MTWRDELREFREQADRDDPCGLAWPVELLICVLIWLNGILRRRAA